MGRDFLIHPALKEQAESAAAKVVQVVVRHLAKGEWGLKFSLCSTQQTVLWCRAADAVQNRLLLKICTKIQD